MTWLNPSAWWGWQMLSERVSFHVRCYPSKKSVDGLLSQYLNEEHHHPAISKRDLVFKALRLCFVPYAYQAVGRKSSTELRKIAQESARELEWYLQQLYSDFAITPSNPATIAAPLRPGISSYQEQEWSGEAQSDVASWAEFEVAGI